jgi:hypothetical protein
MLDNVHNLKLIWEGPPASVIKAEEERQLHSWAHKCLAAEVCSAAYDREGLPYFLRYLFLKTEDECSIFPRNIDELPPHYKASRDSRSVHCPNRSSLT